MDVSAFGKRNAAQRREAWVKATEEALMRLTDARKSLGAASFSRHVTDDLESYLRRQRVLEELSYELLAELNADEKGGK